jgi:DNA-binding MarR family transcriptional regulator
LSFREELEITIAECLDFVEIMRDVDPWIPIQTVHAYFIICYQVMVHKRIMRGVELAEFMHTTQASATRNLQLLCKYELIEIHESPINKTDRLIKLTAKGRAKMQSIRRMLNQTTTGRDTPSGVLRLDVKKGGKNERKTKRK